MFQMKKRIESVLDLSAQLVAKNKAFTLALKQRRPQEELKALHSEIQEIYNHIALLNEAKKLDKQNMLKDQISMMKEQMKKI